VPGGVALVDLGPAPARPNATYGGKPVLMLADSQRDGAWLAVADVALARTGRSIRLSSSGVLAPS